jgi:hypothetical protein
MGDNFITEAWSELAIGIVCIFRRLYFRFTQVGLHGMTLDDYSMIFAGVSRLKL